MSESYTMRGLGGYTADDMHRYPEAYYYKRLAQLMNAGFSRSKAEYLAHGCKPIEMVIEQAKKEDAAI